MISGRALSTASKIRLARTLHRVVNLVRAAANLTDIAIVRRRGVLFELDLAEGIDFAMYLRGAFEFDTHRALTRLVRHGDTVVDIGANCGAHTLPLANMVGDEGRVIAFEPTDFAFARLRRNLDLNPDLSKRVTPVQAYLDDGKRNGSRPLAFYASWRLERGPGQHPRHLGSLQDAGHAAAWTLDSYSMVNRLERVAVIKLDVDGFECKVLRGAALILERDRPAIVAEICPYALEEHGSSAEEMLGILLNHGYSFHDERTFAPLATDPRTIKASIKPGSSINLVALARRPVAQHLDNADSRS